MEIKMLSEGYLRGDTIYEDFLKDQIHDNVENFTGEIIWIEEAPDFPVYLNVKPEERIELYLEAFNVMSNSYLNTPRDVHFDSVFWYSLLCTTKREKLLKRYPEIGQSEKSFRNIVLKDFDWENYIYKCVLGAQYICDNFKSDGDRKMYFELIVNNLDLFNYIIKYEVFRNDRFLINVLDIIKENGLSEILKAKIKGREDLGKDERIGRRVIFEFNKSYPVVLAPTLDKKELEGIFLEHLGKYYQKDIAANDKVKNKTGVFGLFGRK